ncbi:peptidylprolyl isomerase [Zavarzinella formosa]|uniref:peptidylprolyl isomerase n=1 Tax=Zavarzinella formosa TaxID=360055 RepID=UPI0002FEC5B0|nr:peptidylprolyl isomerase [Zavarzinella formosa]
MNRMIATICILLGLAVHGQSAEITVASVNGDAITLRELDAVLAQSPPSLTPLTNAQKRRQKLETVAVLVDEKLIRQFLIQQAIPVEPAEVSKQFAALEATLKEQGKTMPGYLREAGLTEERIRENFRMMLQLAKFIDTQITEEKLKAYHAENRDFFEQTTVRTSHVVIRAGEQATPEERQKAKTKLQELRAEILAKKLTFADAARQHSQCPSAPKGGDIGFVNRKWQVDEAYAKAAFALEIGQVSEVIESDFGYHLITVTERKPGKAVKYEEISREVRDCYETEIRQLLLAQLRKKAKVEITLP